MKSFIILSIMFVLTVTTSAIAKEMKEYSADYDVNKFSGDYVGHHNYGNQFTEGLCEISVEVKTFKVYIDAVLYDDNQQPMIEENIVLSKNKFNTYMKERIAIGGYDGWHDMMYDYELKLLTSWVFPNSSFPSFIAQKELDWMLPFLGGGNPYEEIPHFKHRDSKGISIYCRSIGRVK